MLVLIRVLVKLMLHNLLPHQIMKKSCEIYCVANVHYTQTHTHTYIYIYIYIYIYMVPRNESLFNQNQYLPSKTKSPFSLAS